jgi:hypothetical protein
LPLSNGLVWVGCHSARTITKRDCK